MSASNASNATSNANAARDDDFLAQHLSNLLVRQPSSARSDREEFPPNPNAVNMSERWPSSSSSCKRQSSLKYTPPNQRQSRKASESATTRMSPPSSRHGNDIFDSFFKSRRSDSSQDEVASAHRSSVAELPRAGPSSEPAQIGTNVRRRGPSSISMSTAFGVGSQGKRSKAGTDLASASSDGSSYTSHSSQSSESESNRSFAQHPWLTSNISSTTPPYMLGDPKNVRYATNQTSVTTPTGASEFSGMSSGKVANTGWNPAFIESQMMQYRRPSMTLSNATSSFSSSASPSSSDDASLSAPSGSPTELTTEHEKQTMFDNGSAIEPPDAVIESPDLSDRIRKQLSSSPALSPCGSDNARHTSMMSKRIAVKSSSRTVRNSFQESCSSFDGLSQGPPSSTQRGQGSEMAGSTACLSTIQKPSPDCESGKNDKSYSTFTSPARRKQSVTLVPSGEDGRTFRFVTAAD